MREASTVSPFSAATRQERQARWLLWQQQSVEAVAEGDMEPEPSTLMQRTYPAEPPVPAIQHRRYDAVVQRMQNARKQAGAYSTWA